MAFRADAIRDQIRSHEKEDESRIAVGYDGPRVPTAGITCAPHCSCENDFCCLLTKNFSLRKCAA